tara:strand:+ start:100 stop:294 length:195 start_codon:yes stop_codon:yes gene_type:complete
MITEKEINKKGQYFTEGSAIKRECQDGSFDVVAICLDKISAREISTAINYYEYMLNKDNPEITF